MPPLIALLAQQGLSLLGNAIMAKGKDVIEQKLGVNIEEMVQSPDGLIRLKELEIQNEKDLNDFVLAKRDQELKADQMAYTNTASAREMNTRISESANASWLSKNIAPLLAIIVVVGGGVALVTTRDADVRTASVGLMTLVLGFYFGSTVRAQSRDDVIAKLAGAQK